MVAQVWEQVGTWVVPAPFAVDENNLLQRTDNPRRPVEQTFSFLSLPVERLGVSRQTASSGL